jgi:hypothetical protein
VVEELLMMMNAISDILATCRSWTEPRVVKDNPFRLACRLTPPATEEEISRAWSHTSLPCGLRELWLYSSEPELFVDVDYRQWGLKILSPKSSAARSVKERLERPADLTDSDVIVGEFLGDQDLLVVDQDGAVLIALPLDDRADWWRPDTNLSRFFSRYVASNGAKYWEL